MTPTTDTAPKAKRGNGITTPSRRGGSGRVLTDVIVDLGFVARGEMDEAIERANGNGSVPERLLLNDGTLTDDQLARAVAERFGLDHLRPVVPCDAQEEGAAVPVDHVHHAASGTQAIGLER